MSSASAFTRKHSAYWRNGLRLLRQQSRFKVLFILGFAVFFEVGLWLLFHEGFRFLDSFGGVASMVTGRLFSLFFLGMGLMLVMSSCVTAYATLFRSEEVPFLLVRPVPVSHIVLQKYYETMWLSSWAFFFIIIPFVGAYAWHERMSPFFALWTLFYAIPFLLICSGIGVVVNMVVVRCLPRVRTLKIAMALAAVCVIAWCFTLTKGVIGTDEQQFSMSGLIPGMTLSANRLLPSTWLAEGILSLSRGQWGRGFMFLGVLLSTSMLAIVIVEWLGRATFYAAWQRSEVGSAREKRQTRGFETCDALLRWLPNDVRAMIMKDVRTFFRDPMQWSQALVFFGLLGIYFANLRNFNYHSFGAQWQNLITFLNVFSVSAVVCSLGSRFVYPQLSMEGQGFWILGLAPTSMKRILLCKFGLAFAWALTISVALILLSSMMLGADPMLRIVSVAVTGCVAAAVASFSTGLGAIFIDLRQRNPAAIVGGFGGTLNLVFGLAFMLLAILPFAIALHLYHSEIVGPETLMPMMWGCGVWLVVMTAVSSIGVLSLGLKSLEGREY
jgi:ABC-2 type transport system permease protein